MSDLLPHPGEFEAVVGNTNTAEEDTDSVVLKACLLLSTNRAARWLKEPRGSCRCRPDS